MKKRILTLTALSLSLMLCACNTNDKATLQEDTTHGDALLEDKAPVQAPYIALPTSIRYKSASVEAFTNITIRYTIPGMETEDYISKIIDINRAHAHDELDQDQAISTRLLHIYMLSGMPEKTATASLVEETQYSQGLQLLKNDFPQYLPTEEEITSTCHDFMYAASDTLDTDNKVMVYLLSVGHKSLFDYSESQDLYNHVELELFKENILKDLMADFASEDPEATMDDLYEKAQDQLDDMIYNKNNL